LAVAPGAETAVELAALGLLCTGGELACSSAGTFDIYVNGAWVGNCATGAFTPRGAYADTITLINTGASTASITLSSACASMASMDMGFPTPTPWIMHPPEVEDSGAGFQSQTPLGGILPDFGGGVDTWLGIGEDTVNLVNRGNLLYIMGGISVAGMVLAWAISEIKNPRL